MRVRVEANAEKAATNQKLQRKPSPRRRRGAPSVLVPVFGCVAAPLVRGGPGKLGFHAFVVGRVSGQPKPQILGRLVFTPRDGQSHLARGERGDGRRHHLLLILSARHHDLERQVHREILGVALEEDVALLCAGRVRVVPVPLEVVLPVAFERLEGADHVVHVRDRVLPVAGPQSALKPENFCFGLQDRKRMPRCGARAEMNESIPLPQLALTS